MWIQFQYNSYRNYRNIKHYTENEGVKKRTGRFNPHDSSCASTKTEDTRCAVSSILCDMLNLVQGPMGPEEQELLGIKAQQIVNICKYLECNKEEEEFMRELRKKEEDKNDQEVISP